MGNGCNTMVATQLLHLPSSPFYALFSLTRKQKKLRSESEGETETEEATQVIFVLSMWTYFGMGGFRLMRLDTLSGTEGDSP